MQSISNPMMIHMVFDQDQKYSSLKLWTDPDDDGLWMPAYHRLGQVSRKFAAAKNGYYKLTCEHSA